MSDLMTKCVNAHDLCYGGCGAPCPYCEPVVPLRTVDGRFSRGDFEDPLDLIAEHKDPAP